jgi:hypothetical protein
MRSTCLAHLILLDLVTLTILGEEYKLLISSLCISLSFLHYLLSPIFSCLNILNLCSPLSVKQEVMSLADRKHTPIMDDAITDCLKYILKKLTL